MERDVFPKGFDKGQVDPSGKHIYGLDTIPCCLQSVLGLGVRDASKRKEGEEG